MVPLSPNSSRSLYRRRVIDAVLVGQEGVEDRTPLQEMIPVGIGPGQSTDLEAKDDADVIQVHLGHDPLEAQCGPRRWCRFGLDRR